MRAFSKANYNEGLFTATQFGVIPKKKKGRKIRQYTFRDAYGMRLNEPAEVVSFCEECTKPAKECNGACAEIMKFRAELRAKGKKI